MWKKESLEAEKSFKAEEDLEAEKPKESLEAGRSLCAGADLISSTPATLKPIAVVEYAADAAAFDGLSAR